MKLTTTTIALAVLSAAIPAAYALPAAASARQFKLPTCAAESCLGTTNGTFAACAPADLGCLCSLPQVDVQRYAATVQPCVDGEQGRQVCTEGARYQYKELLKSVCASAQFGSKSVEWAV